MYLAQRVKLDEVAKEIRTFGKKVLLITGGESFRKNGYYAQLEKALKKKEITIYEMSGNRTPSLERVREGIALVRKEKIDSVVGIGGGTCMDIAKTIAFGVKQQDDIWEYLTCSKEPDTMEHLPVGTIVTFPSSGSDMNGSTQITNEATGEQAGLSDVYPNFTWQNPQYMLSIGNEELTAAQLTAFVQLSLGYIGLGRSDISENITITLIKQLFEQLDKSLADPGDMDSRSILMTISAFTVNGLTTLGKKGDWCLYPINAVIQNYCDVKYKQAITVIFPYWLKLIYHGQPEITSYFHELFGVEINLRTPDEILQDGLWELFKLYDKYGIAASFSEIHEIQEDKLRLHGMVESLGEMQSIYTELTAEKVEKMILESVRGM
ncbi:iron-containing alcohol dehydrogenase [Enterocloster sp.]|uniref:iron-containing alcohol dehydrogenase n=1 Tax=Enterocloster sp. TaxID=2719315 RepID=UPI00399270EA